MTLQDLAFEGVYSYKRKAEADEENIIKCKQQYEKLVAEKAENLFIEDFMDSIKIWEVELAIDKRKYADALKLYEETFC